MEWEQDISMFDWFFTPNNTSSKVIAITIGTIKYCYNIILILLWNEQLNFLLMNGNESMENSFVNERVGRRPVARSLHQQTSFKTKSFSFCLFLQLALPARSNGAPTRPSSIYWLPSSFIDWFHKWNQSNCGSIPLIKLIKKELNWGWFVCWGPAAITHLFHSAERAGWPSSAQPNQPSSPIKFIQFFNQPNQSN